MWPWTVSASGQYRDLKGWVNSCKWKQSCWHSNRSPLACWMLWIGIVSFVAIQQWKKGGSFQSQSTMPFCNAEDGAQGRLLKSMQNLLGRAKTIFERKALSWEVLLLSVPVQVGKRVRRRDGGGKCSPQHWEISCSVRICPLVANADLNWGCQKPVWDWHWCSAIRACAHPKKGNSVLATQLPVWKKRWKSKIVNIWV